MVSRYELKKKLQEVQKLNNTVPVGLGGSNINNNITETTTSEDSNTLTIQEKKIVKVKTTTMICSDGTQAELYNPLPGTFWKCLGTPDTNGIITLKNQLTGLILTDGNKSYCIGVKGNTNEFELRCVIGKNEVRLNKTFLNIVASSLVKNGLEE